MNNFNFQSASIIPSIPIYLYSCFPLSTPSYTLGNSLPHVFSRLQSPKTSPKGLFFGGFHIPQ